MAAINNPPLAPGAGTVPGAHQFRFEAQSYRSWSSECFASEAGRMLMSGWPAHVGASPDDAGSGAMAWLLSMMVQRRGNNVVKGGMRRFTGALTAVIEEHGGEIRTSTPVRQIEVEHGQAIAAKLAGGDSVSFPPACVECASAPTGARPTRRRRRR